MISYSMQLIKMLRYALTYVQKCDVSQDFVLAVIFGFYFGNKRL